MERNIIINKDCLTGLRGLPDESVDCCVTSPPYWGLRDYGEDGQLGLEATPQLYVEKMVEVISEVHRVLKREGTLWLNIGDTYAAGKIGRDDLENSYMGNYRDKTDLKSKQRKLVKGLKQKDLIGVPWMLAFALREYGWYLRQDIIWSKPNPMPESVTDRCTKSHEYIFMMSKSAKYYYDSDAIKEKAVTPINDKAHHTFGAPGGQN